MSGWSRVQYRRGFPGKKASNAAPVLEFCRLPGYRAGQDAFVIKLHARNYVVSLTSATNPVLSGQAVTLLVNNGTVSTTILTLGVGIRNLFALSRNEHMSRIGNRGRPAALTAATTTRRHLGQTGQCVRAPRVRAQLSYS